MPNATSDQDQKTRAVSEKWIKKFDLLKTIGADDKFIFSAMKSPEFKKLSRLEKYKVSFNWLAFIFGPFYYFSKKMWFKGSFFLGSAWLFIGAILLIESTFEFSFLDNISWVIPAAIYSQLANYDYFKLTSKNEKMWKAFPKIFSKPIGAVGYPIISLLFFLFIILRFDPSFRT